MLPPRRSSRRSRSAFLLAYHVRERAAAAELSKPFPGVMHFPITSSSPSRRTRTTSRGQRARCHTLHRRSGDAPVRNYLRKPRDGHGRGAGSRGHRPARCFESRPLDLRARRDRFRDALVDVPPGRTSFTGDVDLRPALDLIARVVARTSTRRRESRPGLLLARSGDGQPTDNPILGFLPPNVETPEGEGHVTSSMRAKSGLPSGTEIHNQASIVFDANPAIVTADWFNTIDVTAPSSQVARSAGVLLLRDTGRVVRHRRTLGHRRIRRLCVAGRRPVVPLDRRHDVHIRGPSTGRRARPTPSIRSPATPPATRRRRPRGADATTAVGQPDSSRRRADARPRARPAERSSRSRDRASKPAPP